MPLLALCPLPFPEESIFGWILRLADANAVDSPWNIFQVVGLTQTEMQSPSLDSSKLWRLASDDPDLLSSFGYKDLKKDGGYFQFRGQPVAASDLAPLKPKICPDCILENGYASAHWDLAMTTCCHIHGRRLIHTCPCCDREISYFRPAPLVCRCGGSLDSTLGGFVSAEEVALNALIYSVAFRKPHSVHSENAAYTAFADVPLRYLLRFIKVVGTLALNNSLSRDKKTRIGTIDLVTTASNTLANWPNNFHGFLKRLALRPTREKQERLGVLGHIADFSASLTDRDADRQHGSFLRREILHFLTDCWDGPIHPQIIMSLIEDGLKPKWLPVKIAANLLNIDARTLRGIMERGLIRHRIDTSKKTRKIMLLTEDVNPAWFGHTDLLNLKSAAEQLSIPASALRALRKSGDYVQSYFGPDAASYAQRDIETFRNRLLSGRHFQPRDRNHGVRLGSVMLMKFRNKEAKADILRATIKGEIRTVKSIQKSLAELILHPADLEATLQQITNPVHGALTVRQAAVALHTHTSVVVHLIATGYLTEQKNGEIDAASVRSFAEQFTCLNALVNHRHNRIAKAVDFCKRNNLDLIIASGLRADSTRRFIRNADIPLIKGSITARSTKSSYPAPITLASVLPRREMLVA